MTKRILGLGIAAAAAFSLALPAPALADHCMEGTSVDNCIEDVRNICPIEGTYPSCLRN